MSRLDCWSCDHWKSGHKTADMLATNVDCKLFGNMQVGKWLDECAEASRSPGSDVQELADAD